MCRLTIFASLALIAVCSAGKIALNSHTKEQKNVQVDYSFGEPTFGEELLDTYEDGLSFGSYRPYSVTLHYPRNSSVISYHITRIEVRMEQSTSDGDAKITAGGIDTPYCLLLLEAAYTKYFAYHAKFYGLTEGPTTAPPNID